MEIEFYFRLKLEASEMASTPSNIGGLDFSKLIAAVGTVTAALSSVANRLQNVAPQAGSTDAAASQAAQTEIETLASQLNDAVNNLNQINQTAQAVASGGTQPVPVAATPTPEPVTPVPASPTETGGNVPPATTPGQ